MTNVSSISKTDYAWQQLLDKYDILNEVRKKGVYHIEAKDIKEFREPRLMCKWDSSNTLPKTLKENHINVLPDTRHSYVIGDFNLYEKIPEFIESTNNINYVDMSRYKDYESIDINNINSESVAINILVLSNILDDFLETDTNLETFHGRMGTEKFEFDVDSSNNKKIHISVDKAQCEIDGGFENKDSIVILEAKNVIHDDFHIRQLYYPYRLWKSKVKKPIRLVFSVYSNKIFRLYEYEFKNLYDFSSIQLINSKNYSLDDPHISLNDLINVKNQTKVKYSDYFKSKNVPFIQADSFDRVISLLESLYNNPMNDEEIAELMQFGFNLSKSGKPQYRQSQYYFNAGKYLGLFEKQKIGKENFTCLTELGNNVYNMPYKERQLKLVSLILEHQIFHDLFEICLSINEIPDRVTVINKMKELNVCRQNEEVINRRASSVIGWLKWIVNLINV